MIFALSEKCKKKEFFPKIFPKNTLQTYSFLFTFPIMPIVEERVDRLEEALAEFTRTVNASLLKNSQNIANLSRSMDIHILEMRENGIKMQSQMDKMQSQIDRAQSQIDKSQERIDKMDDEILEIREETKQLKLESKRNNQKMAEISRQYGRLVEDFVIPSVPNVLEEQLGLEIISITGRVKRKHPVTGKTQEFDTIVETMDRVFLNSTKNNLTSQDINDLIEDFKVFREYFPELQHKKVCGIVSTFNPHESQLKFANKRGIIVMGLGEYLMELKNPEGFQIQDY